MRGTRNFKRNLKNPKKTVTQIDLQKIPSLIVACCILHNIVIDMSDIIDEGLVLWGLHDEIVDRIFMRLYILVQLIKWSCR